MYVLIVLQVSLNCVYMCIQYLNIIYINPINIHPRVLSPKFCLVTSKRRIMPIIPRLESHESQGTLRDDFVPPFFVGLSWVIPFRTAWKVKILTVPMCFGWSSNGKSHFSIIPWSNLHEYPIKFIKIQQKWWFLKIGILKSSWVSILKWFNCGWLWWFWGYPHFRKPLYKSLLNHCQTSGMIFYQSWPSPVDPVDPAPLWVPGAVSESGDPWWLTKELVTNHVFFRIFGVNGG